MLNVFYGCARKHRIFLPGISITTNDIDKRFCCDITEDIRCLLAGNILRDYDAFIFTPPCNYFSRANFRRDTSLVALQTKDILYKVLDFCTNNKFGLFQPFLIENVQNSSFFKDLYPGQQFVVGGHTFWSNFIKIEDIDLALIEKKQGKQDVATTKRDLNPNVDYVCRVFLKKLKERELYLHTCKLLSLTQKLTITSKTF